MSSPKTRTDFWEAKFASNIERDERTKQRLEALGWSVHTVWECETKGRAPTFWAGLKAFLDDLDRGCLKHS